MLKLILIPTLICSIQLISTSKVKEIKINFLDKIENSNSKEINFQFKGIEKNKSASYGKAIKKMYHLYLNTNDYYEKSFIYLATNEEQFINGKYPKSSWNLKSNNPRKNQYEKDNRKNVDSYSNELPLSSIGYLEARKDSETVAASTCFLIGNGLALTAAHCIYDNESRKFYYDINAHFDKSNGKSFSTKINVKEVYVPCSYVNDHNTNEDWAILKFSKNLTTTLGCFTIASQQSLTNTYYSSIGFPGDKAKFNYYESTGFSINESTPSYYLTYSYGYKGMSGGPIIAYYSEPDERDPYVELSYEYIVGINSEIVIPENGSNTFLFTKAMKIQNYIISICNSIGEKTKYE